MNRSLSLLALVATACAADPTLGSFDVDAEIDAVADLEIPADAEIAPDALIVGFYDEAAPEELEEIGRSGRRLRLRRGLDLSMGPHIRPDLAQVDAAVYHLEEGEDVRETIAELRASGRYRFVEPDYMVEGLGSVNDPKRSLQWNLSSVNAETAWNYSTGAGMVVAVIDTGVTPGTLDGITSVVPGWDFVNNDSNPADDNGHGTFVASIIGARTDNGQGVAGLAPDVSIMPIKVLDARSSGRISNVVAGINYAVANGADVINLSLGSSTNSTSQAAAVASAWAAGVFVTAAAGNAGSTTVYYPAANAGVVAVGAVDGGNNIASYSNRNWSLDLMAPGGDFRKDANGDGRTDGIIAENVVGGTSAYRWMQGTSIATPHVAAAAALVMAEGATNVEAETYLKMTALDLGRTGQDFYYAYGLIQPDVAIRAYINLSSR